MRTRFSLRFPGRYANPLVAGGILVALLVAVSPPVEGQEEGTDPLFDAQGFQKNRAYFSQLPFENIDTLTGGVVLTFTDLVLPGNAGFDVRFQRTYNTKGTAARWSFGIAGIPLKVTHPTGPFSPETFPVIRSADGTRHKTVRLNDGDNAVFVTKGFWRYTPASWT